MKTPFHSSFTSQFGFDTSSRLTLCLIGKAYSILIFCPASPHLAHVPSIKATVQECRFCQHAGSARVTQIHRARVHRCSVPALEISDSGPGDDLGPSLIIPRKADEWTGGSNCLPQPLKPKLNFFSGYKIVLISSSRPSICCQSPSQPVRATRSYQRKPVPLQTLLGLAADLW